MKVFSPGQFYHEVKFEVEGLNPQEVQEKEDAFLHFKGQTIKVSRCVLLFGFSFLILLLSA